MGPAAVPAGRGPNRHDYIITQMSDFRTEMAHPYGVKPPGNRLFASPSLKRVRSSGLGKLGQLEDELLLEMLSLLDAHTLVRLGQTSRAMYVFTHFSDLWRDLTLRTFSSGIRYHKTWRDTFARMHGSKSDHEPLQVEGIYSHLMYRPWMCRYSNLEDSCPGFLRHNDIDRRSAGTLSTAAFVEEYERRNVPVIIHGLVDDWPALRKWDPTYLARQSGRLLFRATSATAPTAANFTMEEYWEYAHRTSEEAPLYLFERDFARVPGLEGDYHVPAYFAPDAAHGSDLFSLLGPKKRPDHKWLVIGPKRSGSIFHIDPNQTNAWNVVIKGRKKWIFYPPHIDPPGVHSSADGADVAVPLSTGEWLLTFWEFHLRARNDPDPSRRPLECVVEEGEAIFVPHGYWHMVVNLDDSIALTHNYVSSSNLGDVLHFLEHKRDQVSGVRDRLEDGAVQPEELYEVFTSALKEYNEAVLAVGLADAEVSAVQEAARQRGAMGSDGGAEQTGRVMLKNKERAKAKTKAKAKAKAKARAKPKTKAEYGDEQDVAAEKKKQKDEKEGVEEKAAALQAFSFGFSF